MTILESFLLALKDVVSVLLDLYVWIIVINAVMSWLVVLDVINTRNRFVRMVGEVTYRLTEPLLRPLRRFIPTVGGIDLSPLVLILAILFIQSFLGHLGRTVS